tara:strand:+ start:1648 stop:2271 length:624 start_codon:yes stop_codon:yes gene_type:complete
LKIFKLKSSKEVIEKAINEISLADKSICLTGGKFGTRLTEELLKQSIDLSTREIYITDERLNCLKQDQVRNMLFPYLSQMKGFNKSSLNFFLQENYEYSYKFIADKLKDNKFDIVFLSLGEDGHLAGQFSNSKLTNDVRFCYTTDAIKEPKERISFTVNHLFSSKKVVLAIMGEEKRKALSDFIEGKGLHSYFNNKKNLVLITDIDI